MEECFFENKNFKDLNPRQVGYEKCIPEHSCGPELREYYLIHYVISGKGELILGGKKYQIGEKHIFIIPPDTIFSFKADREEPWEYTWLCFDGDYAKKLLTLKSPVMPFKEKYFENLLACRKYTGIEAEYLASRLWMIFAQIFRKNRFADYTAVLREYITKNYMKKISIEKIAENMGLSRKYLSALFKQSTGKSPQEFLISLRIDKAKDLMINHGYNVGEAAKSVGYEDSLAFSQLFKRHMGHSPAYYIQMADENRKNRNQQALS